LFDLTFCLMSRFNEEAAWPKAKPHQQCFRIVTQRAKLRQGSMGQDRARGVMTTVIFDLDGTLADTSGDLIAAANACFRDMGRGDVLDPVQDQLTAFHGARAMLRLGFSRGDAAWDEADIDAYYPRLLSHYSAHIDVHTRLYDGVEAALDVLAAQGMRLGICTNKPIALAETLLARLGVRARFGAVLGSDSLAFKKPDPEHLIETIRQVGGDATRSVLIGDTMNDRAAARAAQVPCILVTFGPLGYDDVAHMEPEGLLDHYRNLLVVVRKALSKGGT